MKGRGRRSGSRRAGLSSVYGFVMIYLLVIASLQAISASLSSTESALSAAQQAGQVSQTRALEHIRVQLMPSGNVTATNDGLVPSDLSFLLVRGQNSSRTIALKDPLPVGASVVIDPGNVSSSSIAVVTSLGNVFSASSGVSAGGSSLLGAIPGADGQIYMNPSDPTRFFLAEGSTVSSFSSKTGAELWSFDAGQGEVTDVFPLSDGGLYVSDGYYGDQYTANLLRLSSSGTSVATYSMRLLRLYTTVLVFGGGQPPYPVGSQPVQKGEDSLYAYYDGWFFSSSGPSMATVPSDSLNLAASDNNQFYVYTGFADPGGYGCTPPRGNSVTVAGYSANSTGVAQVWSSLVYFDECDMYPNDLLASFAGSGLLAMVFADSYWSQPDYYGGPYQGTNPSLFVLSSASGQTLRSGLLDSNGYTSVASDGSQVFLAIPSSEQVEVLSAFGTAGGAFFNIGIPASTLVWAYGSLFAISADQVKVFDPSMNLKKTIDFSPSTFYSLSNSKQLEPQMVRPSFLVLNSTSYAALLRNSTGYGRLVIGPYSP